MRSSLPSLFCSRLLITLPSFYFFFFFNDTATTEIYTLSLHDALPISMTNLSTECLIQLTKLGYDATPFNQILKQNAKREMRLRLGKVTVADVLAAQPVTTKRRLQ